MNSTKEIIDWFWKDIKKNNLNRRFEMSATVDYFQLIFLFYACVVLTRIMWNTNSLNEVNFKRGLHIMTSEWKRNVDKEQKEYQREERKEDGR